jgi:hypothetical protein
MAGALSYIAILTLVGIWMLGWLGITVMLGAFFDLPIKGVAITGAVLGPLGTVAILFVGLATSQPQKHVKSGIAKVVSHTRKSEISTSSSDPFA